MKARTRTRLVVGTLLFAIVAVADGLAMLLPGPSSKLGGSALVVAGIVWVVVGVPRLVPSVRRPYAAILVASTAAVAMPLLVLPIAGLWLVATPAALTVWFAVSWALLWTTSVVAIAVLPCPMCRSPYARSGLHLRPLARACLRCGGEARAATV